MRLLLISNSTNAGEEYLDYPKHEIQKFLGEKKVTALFIPYAGVTISFEDYTRRVKERFNEVGHDIISIHDSSDPVTAVKQAEAIVVGGGNTWQLINMIREQQLIPAVREMVFAGTPYIGWSAGSNVACPTIKTTNDMPIVEPDGFSAFGLIKSQINPHYTDINPEGHAGETREDRINEFLVANPDISVLGLREGCMFCVEGNDIRLIGPKPVRVFSYGKEAQELGTDDDFSAFF
jgi:dipeptidase E